MAKNYPILKEELQNLDLSGLKVKGVAKHEHWRELEKQTLAQLKEYFGPNFNFDLVKISDLADFNFYTYPLLRSFALAQTFLLFNFWGFHLDDYLDQNPTGIK